MIERIESIKLLKTLKGTDEEGKPIYWYAGEVYYPDKGPIPKSVLQELSVERRGGPILEVKYKPEVSPPSEELNIEDNPIITSDDNLEEKPETKNPLKLTRTRKK